MWGSPFIAALIGAALLIIGLLVPLTGIDNGLIATFGVILMVGGIVASLFVLGRR